MGLDEFNEETGDLKTIVEFAEWAQRLVSEHREMDKRRRAAIKRAQSVLDDNMVLRQENARLRKIIGLLDLHE